MGEQRRTVRETDVVPPISCLIERPDGSTLEGIVQDLTDFGARVSGNTTGLSSGDQIRLVLVVQSDQKVTYQAEVRHVDTAGRSYGLVFTSRPQLMRGRVAQYSEQMCCRHKQKTPFCAYCGRALSDRQGVTA